MRKRPYRVQIWVNEDELKILKENSLKCGLKDSVYIRKLILDYKPKEKPDEKFYDEMKILRSISINLNQIAKKAHVFGYIDVITYKRESDRLNQFLDSFSEKYLNWIGN